VGTLLSAYTNSRDNNFNLIRFIAASLVLYSHSFPLAKGHTVSEPFFPALNMSAGGVAVDVFFVTSGFLVAGSLFNRNNILAFIWARVLRIYPALIVAVLFCVFVVGVYFTTEALSDFFSDSKTYKFLKRNSTLFWGVKYELPGVFEDLPVKGAINGSLWTLPYEVKMYSYLAIIATVAVYMQRRFEKSFLKPTFLVLAVGAVAANILNHFEPFRSFHFPHLFSMFFVGAAYYLYRDRVRLSTGLFLLLFVALALATRNKDVFFVLYVVAVPYLVFYLAYVPAGPVRGYNRLGDYSYGMYIYAFPVQQSVAALMPGVSVQDLMLWAFAVTLVLAFLSWHLIEKRCLRMKGSYVVFEPHLQRIAHRLAQMRAR
jgi:peptidoglycan/LPS O-acetylase OafA/YrhL